MTKYIIPSTGQVYAKFALELVQVGTVEIVDIADMFSQLYFNFRT